MTIRGTIDLLKERAALRGAALRGAALCRHGQRPGECSLCHRTEAEPAVQAPMPQAPTRPLAEVPPLKPEPVRSSAQALILEAARTLGRAFTDADLVVAVWQRSPERFGLIGHEAKYPDARRLAVLLWGRRGLIAAGLLVRNEGLSYSLPNEPEISQ